MTKKEDSTSHTRDDHDDHDHFGEEIPEELAGTFRGIALAARKFALGAKKAAIAKSTTVKQTVRAVGEQRHLAFASEGAVAGDSILPRALYYGAWGLSGVAIMADIYTKYDDAPEPVRFNTAIYWTAFHIPASLVIPALIIHQVVHAVDHVVQNPQGMAKSWSPRVKMLAPVGAALVSIIPVVPVVDHVAELVMEPTLGSYLGLSFDHHHDAISTVQKRLTTKSNQKKEDDNKTKQE